MFNYGKLRLVSIEDGYNVHLSGEDHLAEYVYVQHVTGNILVDLDDLDITAEWNAAKTVHPIFRWSTTNPGRETFLDQIRAKVTEPDRVDEIVFCSDCEEPQVDDDGMIHVGNSGDRVCEGCSENYYWCEGHDEYVHGDSVQFFGNSVYCDSCWSERFSYCEHCEESYEIRNGPCCDDDDDEGGCDCAPPTLDLTIPNEGGTLAQDESVKVSLPAGTISEQGILQITRLLTTRAADHYHEVTREGADRGVAYAEYMSWHNLADAVSTRLDAKWQTKEGNFTKRLSRLAYKEFKVKVPPAILSEIGNIGNANSQGAEFEVQVTRNLNLPREEFAHEGSCWWTDYYESRCALKSNGGFGLRSFGEVEDTRYDLATGKFVTEKRQGVVTGRAWVMPLKQTEGGSLVPTFDAEHAAAYVVFNGYGNLEGYAPARILAHLVGGTYRKISFSSEPMYVNSGGYLVGPEEVVSKHESGGISFGLDQHANLFDRESYEREVRNVA